MCFRWLSGAPSSILRQISIATGVKHGVGRLVWLMGEIQEDGHLEKDNRLNGTSTVPLESTSKTVPVAFDARSKQRLGAYNTSPWRCHSAPTTPFPVVSTENLLYPVHSNLEMIFSNQVLLPFSSCMLMLYLMTIMNSSVSLVLETPGQDETRQVSILT